MAVRIAVEAITKATVKELNQRQKDAAYATRSATTRVAANGRKALSKALTTNLYRPVPFITKAYSFVPAKDLKNPIALIEVKNPRAEEFIDSIVNDGEHIETEATIQARNNGVLRGAEVLVPTRRAKRNSRKNVGQNYRTYARPPGGIIRKKTDATRGIYSVVNGKFTKVLTPAVPRNYTPKVNALEVVNKEAREFSKIYNEFFARNRARSAGRGR